MEINTFKVNRMPVNTWSWLKVNTIDTELYVNRRPEIKSNINIISPPEIEIKTDIENIILGESFENYFATPSMRKFMEENKTSGHYIRIPAGFQSNKSIEITFKIDEKNTLLSEDLIIEAEAGSRAILIIKYQSEDEREGYHTGRLRVMVHRDAELKIVKAQLFSSSVKHNDYNEAVVMDKGRLKLIQPEIGAKTIESSWNVVLAEAESEAEMDILYVGEAKKTLDFTTQVKFLAAETKAVVNAKGVLTGESKKVFRDTLDFRKGAKGAKGREAESVLMLSPKVRNISAPLLLCQEDDVEGEHAASSGRPDEEVLFYLMGRGLSEAEAQKMLAEASFTEILDQIPEQAIKQSVLELLGQAIEKGGKALCIH